MKISDFGSSIFWFNTYWKQPRLLLDQFDWDHVKHWPVPANGLQRWRLVILVDALKLVKHVSNICRTGFYHIRQLTHIRGYLNTSRQSPRWRVRLSWTALTIATFFWQPLKTAKPTKSSRYSIRPSVYSWECRSSSTGIFAHYSLRPTSLVADSWKGFVYNVYPCQQGVTWLGAELSRWVVCSGFYRCQSKSFSVAGQKWADSSKEQALNLRTPFIRRRRAYNLDSRYILGTWTCHMNSFHADLRHTCSAYHMDTFFSASEIHFLSVFKYHCYLLTY